MWRWYGAMRYDMGRQKKIVGGRFVVVTPEARKRNKPVTPRAFRAWRGGVHRDRASKVGAGHLPPLPTPSTKLGICGTSSIPHRSSERPTKSIVPWERLGGCCWQLIVVRRLSQRWARGWLRHSTIRERSHQPTLSWPHRCLGSRAIQQRNWLVQSTHGSYSTTEPAER